MLVSGYGGYSPICSHIPCALRLDIIAIRWSALLPVKLGWPFCQYVYGFAFSFNYIHVKFIPLFILSYSPLCKLAAPCLNMPLMSEKFYEAYKNLRV